MINFYCPLNFLGVSQHAFGLMKALHQQGEKVTVFPVFGQIQRNDPEIKEWLANQVFFDKKDPGVHIFHHPYMSQFSGKPRLGFSVFELDYLSPLDLAMLKSLDLVATPSHWGQDILKSYGVESTVIPEGVDLEIYKPLNLPERQLGFFNDTIKFLHVGKFEARKSSEEILRAFLNAADQTQKKVHLTMHCLNPFIQGDQLVKELCRIIGGQFYMNNQELKRLEWKGPNWTIFFPYDTIPDMNLLYNQHHLFLHASKAEGWNLPLIEALATGLPSLTTSVTGHTEFLQGYTKNLVLERVQKVPAFDGVWFHDNTGNSGHWFQPDLDEMVDKIKWMIDNVEMLLKKQGEFRKQVSAFSWTAAANKLRSVLDYYIIKNTKMDYV